MSSISCLVGLRWQDSEFADRWWTFLWWARDGELCTAGLASSGTEAVALGKWQSGRHCRAVGEGIRLLQIGCLDDMTGRAGRGA